MVKTAMPSWEKMDTDPFGIGFERAFEQEQSTECQIHLHLYTHHVNVYRYAQICAMDADTQ